MFLGHRKTGARINCGERLKAIVVAWDHSSPKAGGFAEQRNEKRGYHLWQIDGQHEETLASGVPQRAGHPRQWPQVACFITYDFAVGPRIRSIVTTRDEQLRWRGFT